MRRDYWINAWGLRRRLLDKCLGIATSPLAPRDDSVWYCHPEECAKGTRRRDPQAFIQKATSTHQAILILLLLSISSCTSRDKDFDVVVYGATPAGVIAAIAAAREGVDVAIFEPSKHLGGMVTGGLGRTDKGTGKQIGGYTKEFFERVGRKYGKELTYKFEAKVAMQVFREMLNEEGVRVFFQKKLFSVEKEGLQIVQLRFRDQSSVRAKSFIDASYVGDLIAKAGVTYRYGREASTEYDESYAGAILLGTKATKHYFRVGIDPYDEKGNLLPGVQDVEMGGPGEGDLKIQAYNYRLCLTQDPSNRRMIRKPESYDEKRYELLARYLDRQQGMRLHELFYFGKLPNNKYDVNNTGPISTDLIGENWEYPEAGFLKREQIEKDHKDYTLGLFYFLQNSARLEHRIKSEIKEWGLCKDEFVESDNFSPQLYIREARRMNGAYLMKEGDILENTTKEDAVVLGYGRIESHNVQRVVKRSGVLANEGFLFISIPKPYQIPFRSLLPKQSEIRNLVVPVALSATHVAYSSVRMEPVYMMLGHVSGVASAMKAKAASSYYLPSFVELLQGKLIEQKQIIENTEN